MLVHGEHVQLLVRAVSIAAKSDEGRARRTDVVVRSVARAVPSSVISSLTCDAQESSQRLMMG